MQNKIPVSKSIGPGPAAYDAKFEVKSNNASSKCFKIGVRPKKSVLLIGVDPAVPDLGKYEVDSMNPKGRYPQSKFRNSSCLTIGERTDKKIIQKLRKYFMNDCYSVYIRGRTRFL